MIGTVRSLNQSLFSPSDNDRTQSEKDEMLKSLRQTKPPPRIEPGSNDEYVFGCLIRQKNVNPACTPECVRGLRGSDTPACDIVTFIYFGGVLSISNNPPRTTNQLNIPVYLFTDTAEIPELTFQQLRNIMGGDVGDISIYLRQENGSYNYIRDMTSTTLITSDVPLEDILANTPVAHPIAQPIKKAQRDEKVSPPPQPPKGHDKEDCDETSYTWLWVLALLFIALLLFCGWKYSKRQQ
jgi:hypothetical protein